jgi:putative tryptophan/tyrosine transport system substrate-binding protein
MMAIPGSTRSRIIAFAAYDRRLRLELQRLPVRRAEDLEPGFEAARAARAQALLAYAVNVVFDQRNRVAELAIAQRLPSMSDFALIAHSGFLLSYGADVDDLARRAAGYVDRILKGARPAEMPVERPTRFQLAINQRTAQAIGVSLPLGLLLRADLVIE